MNSTPSSEPRADGHVLLVHPPGYHGDGREIFCMFCEGGCSACTRCGAFEGAWPDECPGAKMTPEQFDAVYRGSLNYRDGEWRSGECCKVMRPVRQYLAEYEYRRGWNETPTSGGEVSG